MEYIIYKPILMKEWRYISFIIFLLVLFFLTIFLTTKIKADETKVFYVRIDIKYSNNQIEKSNFLMVPAENDFRTEKFTSVFMKGSADFLNGIPGISIETQARHDAVKRLLEQRGLKSIKSKSTTFSNAQHNEVTMSYEGAVKLPLKVISKKIDKKNHLCIIGLKIEFAPVSFPDKWSVMQIKYKIKHILNNFILLFQ